MSYNKEATAKKALMCGSEYLNCILSDARIWTELIPDTLTKDEKVAFLLNRIYIELIEETN